MIVMRVFISYRRKSYAFAHRLVADLQKLLNADIFIDVDDIDQADFEISILNNLRSADLVLVVVTEHTFAPERIHRNTDWVRREIALALELQKSIVLVCDEGHYPPNDLPENIQHIVQKQGINFYPEYWEPAVRRLADFIIRLF